MLWVDFQNAVFPKLLAYNITKEHGDVILIVEKNLEKNLIRYQGCCNKRCPALYHCGRCSG